ncbi:unnamed protein product (macronuclear) [Paramecium tetraurelia]|uniref:Uncharacterized protein n=1 Tax=Paramecium tetraurelia TaxID=5888 RepID=A0D2Y5_PARTE|nr:uncharacterized protein GSPATT00012887001 [Paramecium tetraurelia]CAK77402.1 unnamed protein product [Paramecium tetraurelia]|eukprot:XP_001444799.1 hypothetical protein (macronuclear) [Paramecium tetraurelia strain d4-2]
MFEEIKVCDIIQDEIQHSEITLSGSPSNDFFECTDYQTSLEIDQIAYIMYLLNVICFRKLANRQKVSINIYNMSEIYKRQISYTSEYLNFSSPITQNGCTLIKNNNTPYLLVVTQVGHIYYKNLITKTSTLLKNLMIENIKIKCFVQSMILKDQFQFYLMTDADLLYHVTLDVVGGEFFKNKYQISFGTKFFSKYFNRTVQDWNVAFQLNDNQILHFSQNTQFSLLEYREPEFQTIKLQCQDSIKTQQIHIIQQTPNGQLFVCYQFNNNLKMCTINQNQLIVNYVVDLSKIELNNPYHLSSTQDQVILIQEFKIYQLDQAKRNLELINENQYSVIGYLSQDTLLLFYKTQLTFIQLISDQISKKQNQLRSEVARFKNNLGKEQNLIDDEIIVQKIAFHPTSQNVLNQFQQLIKIMHKNLDQKKVISIMKQQHNNFLPDLFIENLMDEVEDIYIFIKSSFKSQILDPIEIQAELTNQLEIVNFNLAEFFFSNCRINNPNTQAESNSNIFPIVKSLVIYTLRDYYQMQLEVILGFGVLQSLYQQPLSPDINFKVFYETMCLLSLVEDKRLIHIQQILQNQFQHVKCLINFKNLNSISQDLKLYINIIYNEIFQCLVIPDEYFCEQFVKNQIIFHSHHINSKGIIRHCRIAQQTNQIPTDVIKLIKENQNLNQELKLKISFTIQKQNPKQNEDQNIVLDRLLYYANQLKQHHLLFQIINLNDQLQIKDTLKLIVDNLLSFKLNVRTTDKMGEYLLQFSREKYNNLQNKNKILSYFSYLIRIESKAKAYTLLFEYIVNLESLLFNLQQKDLVWVIRTQLDCINLLLNQMQLHSRHDRKPYAQQIVCKIKDEIYRQFLNPSTLEELREFEQYSQRNIRVINIEQIELFNQYKKIQCFVSMNYSPQAKLQKVVEELILNNNIDLIINLGRLRIDPNYERNVAFCYYWNEDSREQLIQGLTRIMKERELSIVLAQICVYCNLKTIHCQELYCKAPCQNSFLQYLISVDKEQIVQEII